MRVSAQLDAPLLSARLGACNAIATLGSADTTVPHHPDQGLRSPDWIAVLSVGAGTATPGPAWQRIEPSRAIGVKGVFSVALMRGPRTEFVAIPARRFAARPARTLPTSPSRARMNHGCRK